MITQPRTMPTHPLLASGATAAAVLLRRDHPADIPDADLPGLADQLVHDLTVAGRAEPMGTGYAWLYAINRGWPNSPATHTARKRWTDAELRRRVADMFVPDHPTAVEECWFCQGPASERWAKGRLPLWASDRYLNDPGAVAVCRRCRIYTWCIPHASAHGSRRILTITADPYPLQHAIITGLVTRNRTAISRQWERWPTRGGEAADPIIRAAIATRPGSVQLHSWSDDNRVPAYEEREIDRAAATWYRTRAHHDPALTYALELIAGHAHRPPHALLGRRTRDWSFGPLLEAAYTYAEQQRRKGYGFDRDVLAVTDLVMSLGR